MARRQKTGDYLVIPGLTGGPRERGTQTGTPVIPRLDRGTQGTRHSPTGTPVIPRLDRGFQGMLAACRPPRGDLFANGSPRGTRAGAPITRAQQKTLRKKRAPLRGFNLRLFPALAPRDCAP